MNKQPKAHLLWRMAILLAMISLSSFSWAQTEVYSTFPGPGSGGSGLCFGGGWFAATGVQLPAGQNYLIDRIELRLHDFSGASNTPFSVDLFDDNAGNPGTSIASLGGGTGTWAGADTFDIYTVTPSSTVELSQGETYWIVLSSSTVPNICAFGWSTSGTDPAGSIFSYVGERQVNNAGSSVSNWDGSFLQMTLYARESVTSEPALAVGVPAMGTPALLALSLLTAVVGLRRFG